MGTVAGVFLEDVATKKNEEIQEDVDGKVINFRQKSGKKFSVFPSMKVIWDFRGRNSKIFKGDILELFYH